MPRGKKQTTKGSKEPKEKKVKNFKEKKAKTTTNKQEIIALERTVKNIQQIVKPTVEHIMTYNSDNFSVYNTAPAVLNNMTAPAGQRKYMNDFHGVLMSDASIPYSDGEYSLKRVSVDVQVVSAAQPTAVQFFVALIRSTKLGNSQRNYFNWVDGLDYNINNANQFYINPKYWQVLDSKTFELHHYEYLTSIPATNSNQPVEGTYKRFTLNHTWKNPKVIKKGDVSGVWSVTAGEMDPSARLMLVCLHTNPSPSLGCDVEYFCRNHVIVGE